jgi:hypothetical protein
VGLTNAEVADLIDDAADIIEQNSWTRGAAFLDLGGGAMAYCVEGAMHAAIERRFGYWNAGAFCQAAERIRKTLDGASIPYWNDKLAKNKQQVLDTLREAAKKERM